MDEPIPRGGLLLADIEERLHGVCEEMQHMVEIRGSTQVTTRETTLYHLTLVVLQVGCGYLRPIPNSTKTGEVPDCGSGLFHKVDRSRIGCHNLDRKNQMLLLEEDNLSVWLAEQNSVGQRDTVHLLVNRELLRSFKNQTTVHIGGSFPIKRPD
ncbi:hypothetical protein CR513_37923, partial [Mucuna pruriens]